MTSKNRRNARKTARVMSFEMEAEITCSLSGKKSKMKLCSKDIVHETGRHRKALKPAFIFSLTSQGNLFFCKKIPADTECSVQFV